MLSPEAKFAAARTEEIKNGALNAESMREIQHYSYLSGWHAAMAEVIKILMKMQLSTPKTPYDEEKGANQ